VVPVEVLRSSRENIKSPWKRDIPESLKNMDVSAAKHPSGRKDFQSYLDAYSDPVSYKQKIPVEQKTLS
jgi:hypothetical protein